MKRKIDFEYEVHATSHSAPEEADRIKLEKYAPAHFLRCHSADNDPADVQTQVWQCAFEPDIEYPGKMTNIVATCGGNRVCLIDSQKGTISKKYVHDTRVMFYSLAWSTIPLSISGGRRTNILAVGDSLCGLHLLHPDRGVCYTTILLGPKKKTKPISVNCLLFHPRKSTWLFCGLENGSIKVWDIDIPTLPDYQLEPVLLVTIDAKSPIYSLAYHVNQNLLIVASESGLKTVLWDLDKVKEEKSLLIHGVEVPDEEELGNDVDSVAIISDDVLAFKCPEHGHIYSTSVKQLSRLGSSPLYETLEWCTRSPFFLRMSCGGNLLACGDDSGCIWLYDTTTLTRSSTKLGNLSEKDRATLKPVKLPWPVVKDKHLDAVNKLPVHVYDIEVNCVAAGEDGTVVAVTCCNMVCIWRPIT